MKPAKKTDRKPIEEEKVVHVKKKLDKIWSVEYMITDEEYLNRYSWFKNEQKLGVWINDSWRKYLSLEHAVQQLNKEARSGRWKETNIKETWMFAGRDFRLYNKETGERVPLILGAREIWADKRNEEAGEKGGDPAGSPEGDQLP